MAKQNEQTEPEIPSRTRRRRRGRVGFGMVVTLTFAGLLLGFLFLSLSGRSVPVPEFFRAIVEKQVNSNMVGASLKLREIEFAVGRDGVPHVLMSDLRLADQQGGAVIELNQLRAALSLGQLIRGEVAASSLHLSGAQITVRRTADGSFAFRSNQLSESEAENLPDLFRRIDRVMSAGALASLKEVAANGVVITLEDARSGRIWQATNATAVLRKGASDLSLSVTSDVFNGSDEIAGIQLSLTRNRKTGTVFLGVSVSDMPGVDIALQSPVLSWLGVLDAPISGSVRTELDRNGGLASFAGTFDIAPGALKPSENVPPAKFNSAKAYFTFDPARQRIDFSELNFEGADGELLATGHTYLSELDGPWPRAFLGQFKVEKLDYAGGEVFEGPLSLDDIRVDLRLRLDPFSVELAQVVIDNEGIPLAASGLIETNENGWQAAIDAKSRRVTAEQVLAFWPVRVSPITRGWISRNLRDGTILNSAAALRFRTGKKPEFSLSFDFEDGVAKFLPRMPLLTGIEGRATMIDHSFALTIERGKIEVGEGEGIDAAGSVFRVADVRSRPAWGEIQIATESALTDALTVLNNPPLRIMERARRPVDIAKANAVVNAIVRLPLKDGIQSEDVTYQVSATLRDVNSTSLVPGRVFASPELSLTADETFVGLDGTASLDGVPLTANWRQSLGSDAGNGGAITGTIALSDATAKAFELPLPDSFIHGEAGGFYRLTLPIDGPSELELTSTLKGVTLSVPSLGWFKPVNADGNLELEAILSDIPIVKRLRLSSPGLSLDGTLSFDGNGFSGAQFLPLRVGDWLDASVELIPRPGGDPAIAITGGRFDLRRFDIGGGSASGGGGGSSQIDIQLDALVVSDGVTLSPVSGRIRSSSSGLTGTFEGRVNGKALVNGTLAPANSGTAIRLRSDDASGVLRDAGLTPNAQDGRLDLVLTPVRDAPDGTYDGQFLIEDIRLRKAPVMADLLDAISVVGLLDQLAGPGIKFDTVDGQFRLTRQKLTLQQAAAVGSSIGISADGVINLVSKQMDFRGVISPVYFLNGIGSILTRRGEGFFGFNYRVAGVGEDARVGVNPLSIFTPGAFRRIFRRAPPGQE